MFRTVPCLSSGGQIVSPQPLVSSLSVSTDPIHPQIYMLRYNPQHVSSSTMLIFRRTNCIITASGIVTLCPLSTGILYSRLQRVTIPEAVVIQFVLLKMSMVLLETC